MLELKRLLLSKQFPCPSYLHICFLYLFSVLFLRSCQHPHFNQPTHFSSAKQSFFAPEKIQLLGRKSQYCSPGILSSFPLIKVNQHHGCFYKCCSKKLTATAPNCIHAKMDNESMQCCLRSAIIFLFFFFFTVYSFPKSQI